MLSSTHTVTANKPSICRRIVCIFSALFLSTVLSIVYAPETAADQWRSEHKETQHRSILKPNSRGGCTEYQRRTVTTVYNRYGRALYGGSTSWTTYRRSGRGCFANRNVR